MDKDRVMGVRDNTSDKVVAYEVCQLLFEKFNDVPATVQRMVNTVVYGFAKHLRNEYGLKSEKFVEHRSAKGEISSSTEISVSSDETSSMKSEVERKKKEKAKKSAQTKKVKERKPTSEPHVVVSEKSPVPTKKAADVGAPKVVPTRQMHPSTTVEAVKSSAKSADLNVNKSESKKDKVDASALAVQLSLENEPRERKSKKWSDSVFVEAPSQVTQKGVPNLGKPTSAPVNGPKVDLPKSVVIQPPKKEEPKPVVKTPAFANGTPEVKEMKEEMNQKHHDSSEQIEMLRVYSNNPEFNRASTVDQGAWGDIPSIIRRVAKLSNGYDAVTLGLLIQLAREESWSKDSYDRTMWELAYSDNPVFTLVSGDLADPKAELVLA